MNEPVALWRPTVTFTYMIVFIRQFAAGLAFATAVTFPAFAEGDREYGEYLSSECVTCHQTADLEAKIPVIHGMDAEAFVDIMKAYRAGELENPTMITISKRLTDEDISAMAAYFASLPNPYDD